jgi:hypothetical protein
LRNQEKWGGGRERMEEGGKRRPRIIRGACLD